MLMRHKELATPVAGQALRNRSATPVKKHVSSIGDSVAFNALSLSSVELVHRIDHRHNVLHRRLRLHIMN
jgi:hypothetical protein